VAGVTCGAFPGQTSAGSCDAFVRKYDPSGNELWTRQFGFGVGGDDVAFGVAVDGTGNVYLAGFAESTLFGQTEGGGGFVRKYAQAGQPVAATVTTVIHLADHTPAPCFAERCKGRVAPASSVVHDLATIASNDPAKTPTGTVEFRFWKANRDCSGRIPTRVEGPIALIEVSPGVASAESSDAGPLDAGVYSYGVRYFPDDAAKAQGFRASEADCEPLRVIKVSVGTLIRFQDGQKVPSCTVAGCEGQVAPSGSVVQDKATVTSETSGPDPDRTPTGSVEFAFFAGDLRCGGSPSTVQTSILSGSRRVTTADSADTGPLAPGNYSYKAVYLPDAAAKALGLGSAAADCEQLLVQ
jgi:hypothetical protein